MDDLQKGNSDEHRKDKVEIRVNDIERLIHRGKQTVIEIKTVGLVPLNHMLEQLIDGKLNELDDDGSVIIHGGEIFIGHVKDGGSSNK
jgi:hypothetical protein